MDWLNIESPYNCRIICRNVVNSSLIIIFNFCKSVRKKSTNVCSFFHGYGLKQLDRDAVFSTIAFRSVYRFSTLQFFVVESFHSVFNITFRRRTLEHGGNSRFSARISQSNQPSSDQLMRGQARFTGRTSDNKWVTRYPAIICAILLQFTASPKAIEDSNPFKPFESRR